MPTKTIIAPYATITKNIQREIGRAFLLNSLGKENLLLVTGSKGVLAQKAPTNERKETPRTARNIVLGPWAFNNPRPNMGPIVIPTGTVTAYIPMP